MGIDESMENMRELKVKIDKHLKDYFKNKGSYDKKIYEAMTYSLEAGGKRIRPILFLNTYELYKKDYNKAIEMAASIEMIHTYSLIHDDLPSMDNDDLRRGRPTNHKVFGEAIAILAGDGLLNEAMNIMFKYSIENGLDALKSAYLISEAAGVNGMIGGQVVDILSENKEISKKQLNYMHKKKTGALIKASILAGATAAGAGLEDLNYLEDFGEKLGLAFQIKDDILDVTGDSKLLGKKVKSDEENNKTTFIKVYGIENCKTMCENLTKDCLNILDKLDRNTEKLRDITLFLLKRDY
ncbi:polyprenyl synthetase family protein [Clostridium niameyense]